MYNEERKNNFISSMYKSDVYSKSVFNTTAPYEEDAGKDLCELPIEVLQPLVNSKFGSSTHAVTSLISFFRAYVAWCKDQGYPTCNDTDKLKTVTEQKVKRVMVGSPAHLESILNKVFEPVDRETVDCLYRCYLWMAFSGLEEAETVNVRVDEVDFDTMTIEHDGKSYEIYREALPAFKMACNATQFRYINANYATDKREQYRNRYVGEYLFRGIRSAQVGLSALRSFVAKKFKASGVEITYSKIRLSGMFYKVYEMERIGEPANFDVYIVERINKTEHEYHANHTRGKLMGSIRRNLENDYSSWKNVFTR